MMFTHCMKASQIDEFETNLGDIFRVIEIRNKTDVKGNSIGIDYILQKV